MFPATAGVSNHSGFPPHPPPARVANASEVGDPLTSTQGERGGARGIRKRDELLSSSLEHDSSLIDVDKIGKPISTSAVSGGDPRVTRKKSETASRAAGCSTFPTCRCAIFPRLESFADADRGGLSAMLRPARPSVNYWPQVRAVLGNSLDPSTASCWAILLASCRSQRGRLLYQNPEFEHVELESE